MAKVLIDVWGRNELEPGFNTKPQVDYETDAPEGGVGVVYTRFFNRDTCMVHRTTVATADGRTQVRTEVAYGAWADRANLEYAEGNDYPKHVEIAEEA